MLIWSTNTIIQSRNTDIATKQYSNSSNSVLHKVQSPWYNTTKHQVTDLKPAAGMCQQYMVPHNTIQVLRPTGTPMPKGWNHVATWAIVNTGQASTEMEPAVQHPALLHTQQKRITATASPNPALSWSPAQCSLPERSSAIPSLQQADVSRPSPPIKPLGSRC